MDAPVKECPDEDEIARQAAALVARARPRPETVIGDEERRAMRQAGIAKRYLSRLSADQLSTRTGIRRSRAAQITGLAGFQMLDSVGPSIAADLWQLGYDCPDDLRGSHPLAMYRAFSAIVGDHVDQCVEDVFRCAVAQAERPDLPAEARNWWYWTHHRGARRLPLSDDNG